MDKKTRALLVTLRAALIMAVKAIEKYLDDEAKPVAISEHDSVTVV